MSTYVPMAVRNAAKKSSVARPSYHHGSLRDALVAAAVTLVEEVGADTFSLRDAAKSVGVTPSATYRHFESKSALLTAVAADTVTKFGNRLGSKLAETERGLPKANAKERAIAAVKSIGRAYVAFAAEQPELFRVLYGRHGLCQLAPSLADAKGPTEYFRAVLDDLVSAGCMAPERRPGADFRVWTIFHGFATLVADENPLFSSAEARAAALEELLDFALEALCGRPTSKLR